MNTLIDSMLKPYSIFAYVLIFGWVINASVLIFRLWKSKDLSSVNQYIYESIPSVFTTLGLFGTFLGIFFGLLNFDVNDITNSIPKLLEGLQTAFLTSILGIVFALISSRISKIVLRIAENEQQGKSNDELSALNRVIEVLTSGNQQAERQASLLENTVKVISDSSTKNNENFKKLNASLIGETDDSISTQLVKLRNLFNEVNDSNVKQNKALESIQASLGGNNETSLLTQIQKLRSEQNEYSKDTKKYIEWIVESMGNNSKIIHDKFDEFAELLAKNNTEALVEVMKAATEQFNAQMSELINKLVQENFKELNNSVERLNTWQQENKEMIQSLTNQFKQVSEEFQITSQAINVITINTKSLTDEDSHLTKLIQELQKVMIDDKKFTEITNKIVATVDTLKENTEAFDETTNKLNEWVKNQMNFSDSVAILLTRLQEIEKIKDINELFWNNTKKQLNEAVGIIEKASTQLRNDLDNINQQFYEQLNDTFQNLDTLIQRTIENYQN